MRLPIVVTVLALLLVQAKCQGLLGRLIQEATNTFGSVLGGILGRRNDVVQGLGRGNDVVQGISPGRQTQDCAQDVRQEYAKGQTEFHTNFYKHVTTSSDNHYVYSPFAIWLTLLALAEGASPALQAELFNNLKVPQEACLRKKFYDIAANIELPDNDVYLLRKRKLFLSENSRLNPAWHDLVRTAGLLDVTFMPMTQSSVIAQQLNVSPQLITLNGNSLLLDSIEYGGVWTTAFPATSINQEPFYNELGQQIGTVPMMRMRKRVRLAHFPLMNAKVLELPVGVDARYKMLLTISLGNDVLKNALEIFMGSILEIFSQLRKSLVPIEIAVPKFAMSSEYNARPFLEQLGFDSFWNDPEATSYISTPPALPSSLIQRVIIHIGPDGHNPVQTSEIHDVAPGSLISAALNIAANTATGLAAAIGRDFVANRPFMFALYDTETNTCLFAGAYSKPIA